MATKRKVAKGVKAQAWLCRNLGRQGSYLLFLDENKCHAWPTSGRFNWDFILCPKQLHRLFPHLRLKPDEGPVEIKIDAHLVAAKPAKRKAAKPKRTAQRKRAAVKKTRRAG